MPTDTATEEFAVAANLGATRRYVGGNCLIPVNATTGDIMEVQCWIGGDGSTDGLAQSFAIYAPRTIALTDY